MSAFAEMRLPRPASASRTPSIIFSRRSRHATARSIRSMPTLSCISGGSFFISLMPAVSNLLIRINIPYSLFPRNHLLHRKTAVLFCRRLREQFFRVYATLMRLTIFPHDVAQRTVGFNIGNISFLDRVNKSQNFRQLRCELFELLLRHFNARQLRKRLYIYATICHIRYYTRLMLCHLSCVARFHCFSEFGDVCRDAVSQKPTYLHIYRNVGVIKAWNTTGTNSSKSNFIVCRDRITARKFGGDKNRYHVFFRGLFDNRDQIVLPFRTHIALSERLEDHRRNATARDDPQYDVEINTGSEFEANNTSPEFRSECNLTTSMFFH